MVLIWIEFGKILFNAFFKVKLWQRNLKKSEKSYPKILKK